MPKLPGVGSVVKVLESRYVPYAPIGICAGDKGVIIRDVDSNGWVHVRLLSCPDIILGFHIYELEVIA